MTAKRITKKNVPTRETRDPYLDFLQGIALKGVGLDKISADLDRTSLTAAGTAGELGDLTMDTEFGVIVHTDDILVTSGTFKLGQINKKTNSKLLSMECTFSAMFGLAGPISDETAARFANTEAKLIFWPYLRHFIMDASFRMAINPILVPLITNTPPASKPK